jgi:hypothetical protein
MERIVILIDQTFHPTILPTWFLLVLSSSMISIPLACVMYQKDVARSERTKTKHEISIETVFVENKIQEN